MLVAAERISGKSEVERSARVATSSRDRRDSACIVVIPAASSFFTCPRLLPATLKKLQVATSEASMA